MRLLNPLIILYLIILIAIPGVARGQPYREGLSIPPVQVFGGMLGFAKAGDFAKIERSLHLLTPLLSALFQKYQVDHGSETRSAISAKDKDKVLKEVQRLISSDMRDLFDQADIVIRESNEKAKVKFKTAFLDYLLLGPFIEARSFKSDGKIKRAFRDIQFTIDGSAPYGTTGPGAISPEAIRKMSDEIIKEIQSVMPEWK